MFSPSIKKGHRGKYDRIIERKYNIDQEELSHLIRDQLKVKSWTQMRLATETGYSPASIGGICSADRKTSDEALGKIAHILNIDLTTYRTTI